jgi:hypothetical protein
MLCPFCLFTFCTSCTLLHACVTRLFVTSSRKNAVIRVPVEDAIVCLHYCLWCRLIVNSLEECITKAFLTTLISQIVFACVLLIACVAWHNISVYITYPLFCVNELCVQPNLPPQHLLHASLEPPKSPLASVSWLLVRAHDTLSSAPRLWLRSRGLKTLWNAM